MKQFMGEDFLLGSDTAIKLYKNYAADMPIIDYHCHIDPSQIASDKRFDNMAQIWLTCGDHYKWRAIRTAGYAEEYVTGNASDYEKFRAFACTLPLCIGNPLYHWAHMELRKYFGYDGILSESTCDEVWEKCNARLREDDMSVRSIIRRSNVKLICTTDDPVSPLADHKSIAADKSFDTKVLPAFRPDRVMNIGVPGWRDYIAQLSDASGIRIDGYNSLLAAYVRRLDYFAENGCLTADHGFQGVSFHRAEDSEQVARIFAKALSGSTISVEEAEIFRTELNLFFGRQYSARGWIMQLHFGVSRNNSSRLFASFGPDAGGDAIGCFDAVLPVTRLLNELDMTGELPKTVLYSINPNDNTAIDALIGCFQGGGVKYKLQHGSAWWFNDNISGMRDQMMQLANNSLLAGFIGMLTDSRSFLSYTRHDYFRRILCDVIGGYVERGEYPADMEVLGGMVRGICYNNTAEYFGFKI
ncbi:MAG: glucuronate isomerase [Eubacteriales bacterium]